MKASFLGLMLCLTSSQLVAEDFHATLQVPAPPDTRQDDVKEVLHGITITDPYRWLEDQDSPETRAWITKQNSYTHGILDGLPGRDALRSRLTELMRVDWIGTPIERGGRLFYRREAAAQEQPVIYMRNGVEGREEVLIDPNPMSADHSTNVKIADISLDGKLLAYEIRLGGKDESEVHLMDVDTRRDLTDQLPAAVYFDVSFLPNKTGFYYTTMAEDGPRVRLHKLGTKIAADIDIFGKGYGKDVTFDATPTDDGRYLILHAYHGSAADKTEIWIQNLADNGPITPIVKDIDARFSASASGDHLFIQTNWKAPLGRVMAVSLDNPGFDHWQEVVPQGDAAIDNFALADGKLVITYVKNASSAAKIFTAEGKPVGELAFPGIGSMFAQESRWENRNLFFGFDSFNIPRTIYRYDMKTGEQSAWAHLKIPIDESQIEVKQVWVTSKDGTQVPMFLVNKKGLKADGSNRALLTGYGGFNASMTPAFSPFALLWAERGGVFASVNLRGGGEFGEAWHQAGMLGKKQNVFDDFIAASQWLIDDKYTQPSKLAIDGGSNGGLLVGAALTQRPDLYRAVVCWHPLLDMLRYDKFMEAQFWVSEYGTATDPEQFKWLYAYSPYQHVKPDVKYPAVLFMTGDGDTRVAPLHARKMAALLQRDSTSGYPVLLRYELTAGHSGGRSMTQIIDDETDELSFLLWQADQSTKTR